MSDFIALVQNQLHGHAQLACRWRQSSGYALLCCPWLPHRSAVAAPIIVKINDDKKKLVGCEDSHRQYASISARLRQIVMINP